jgi:hypothetical protein
MKIRYFIQFIVKIIYNYNKLETNVYTPLEHIKKLNDMIEYYYNNITYESYIKNVDKVKDDIKHLLSDDVLLELINFVNNDYKLNLTLMELIINTLDTDLWYKYCLLLSSNNDKMIFIKNTGIFLLKLNPCSNYYGNDKRHFKSLLELDKPIIDTIKPEFMRLFSIQFKNILKTESKNYHHMDNITKISKNIANIFEI